MWLAMRREVFVFGSNLAGKHGKGAALAALRLWGAEYGNGRGLQGNSYALPTKDRNLMPLPIYDIEKNIVEFLAHAREHPKNLYLLTPVGTGLAGYSKREISGILRTYEIPENVVLTKEWIE